MLQREEAIASIKRELDKTAQWRAELSLRYPHDKRNERSTRVLHRLADRTHDMSDEDWASLQPLFAADSRKFNEAVSRVSRRTGFRLRQPSARFFLHQIVEEFHGDEKVAA